MDIKRKLETLSKLNETNLKKWDEIETVLITKTINENTIFIPKCPFINYNFNTNHDLISNPLEINKKILDLNIESLENIEPLEFNNEKQSKKINRTELEKMAEEYL